MCNKISKPLLVSCEWSNWSSWSECSSRCGIGVKSRTRTKRVQHPNGEDVCEGKSVDKSTCWIKECSSEF